LEFIHQNIDINIYIIIPKINKKYIQQLGQRFVAKKLNNHIKIRRIDQKLKKKIHIKIKLGRLKKNVCTVP